MRCLVTGVDESGRSIALRHDSVTFADLAPGLSAARLFATTESPPRPRSPGRGELVDLGVGPGLLSLVLWRFDPGAQYPMHHTDTVDVDVVLEGSVELVLDDGPHLLATGDCAVVTGVDHSWRTGEEGCVIGAIALGSITPT